MDTIKGVKYKEIFKYFEEISAIPRGSGNEKAISDYLVAFAESHKLEVHRDKAMNVVIKKPAAVGYEKAPIVILQGHMDMVCEKNKGTQHDFEKDPIRLKVVDDMVYAEGTTLGADNGIAVAYALALLASEDILHPALEVLLTTEEETSMRGAFNLDAGLIKGRLLINLDSEEEGKLLVSSAGGRKAKVVLPVEWEAAPADMMACYLRIDGLKGGHSGAEIDKGRGNANKLMGRLLNDLNGSFRLHITEINGGMKSNAIPRECEALVLLEAERMADIELKLREWNETFRNELRVSDANIRVSLDRVGSPVNRMFSEAAKERLIAALVVLPNGIQTMSMDIKDLPESSTNLGVISTTGDELWLYNEIRSALFSQKLNIFNQVAAAAELLGGKTVVESDYPEWAYNPDSPLRSVFSGVYREKYGREPEIVAIHAGLECGVFMGKMKGLDAISLGPDTFDVHTPDEHFSISSAERVWEYLLEVLKQMKV